MRNDNYIQFRIIIISIVFILSIASLLHGCISYHKELLYIEQERNDKIKEVIRHEIIINTNSIKRKISIDFEEKKE